MTIGHRRLHFSRESAVSSSPQAVPPFILLCCGDKIADGSRDSQSAPCGWNGQCTTPMAASGPVLHGSDTWDPCGSLINFFTDQFCSSVLSIVIVDLCLFMFVVFVFTLSVYEGEKPHRTCVFMLFTYLWRSCSSILYFMQNVVLVRHLVPKRSHPFTSGSISSSPLQNGRIPCDADIERLTLNEGYINGTHHVSTDPGHSASPV